MTDIRNAPNRHSGTLSSDCSCGLIHDDEMHPGNSNKKSIIEKLGGKCSNPDCGWLNPDGTKGCSDFRILEIDHVFNDGFLERKKYKAAAYLPHILKNVDSGNYQLLCSNCHALKTRRDSITQSFVIPYRKGSLRLVNYDVSGKVPL